MPLSLDLALGPASIFKDILAKPIKELTNKTADSFISIPKNKYVAVTKQKVKDADIPSAYKKYMLDLISVVETDDRKLLDQLRESTKLNKKTKDINTNEVEKYFGELLAPIHVMKDRRFSSFTNVVFPTRTNYELYDFFLSDTKEHVGFSVKVGSSSSNTLSPTFIAQRLSSLQKSTTSKLTEDDKLSLKALNTLGNAQIIEGIFLLSGMLVQKKKFPSGTDKGIQQALSSVDWSSIATTMQKSKNATLSSLKNVSGKPQMKYFLDKYVLPRLTSATASEQDKKKYLTGQKEYTVTNLAYGLGMFIVDANKSGEFDFSFLLGKVFNDYFYVTKLSIQDGTPKFTVKTLYESAKEEKLLLRSKYRWTVIKDKLGIQL